MDCQVQEHVKLTRDDFRNINKIISNHWRYHKAEDPTTSLSQALNEEIGKILHRPENRIRRVTHETLFQIPSGKGIQPPLFEAVRRGCMKAVLYFVTRFGDVIDFASATEPHRFLSSRLRRVLHDSNPSVHGSSILNEACHISFPDRCLEIVEILVSRGASVNSRDCYNHTPLMEAAGVDNMEVLKYLVEQGADVDASDKGGCTALFYTVSSKNSVNAIRYLVSKGANITHRSMLGYTALHFAALHGDLEAVKELLALGASPEFVKVDSLKPNYVPPPLLLAASHRHRKVVDVFLEHQDCTTELRIDALLLLGCGNSHVDSVEPLWREALTLREKCLASMQFLPPLEAFGGQTEIHTTADLDAVMSSKDDMQYQSWIIRERCIGDLEHNDFINACVRALEMFRSSQYSEAEMLLKHVLKKLLSLVQLLPCDMRAYELNHSGISILNHSFICINVTVPEMVQVTNGKGPNVKLFVEYCLRCLEFFIDAAKSQSCKEDHSLSHMVSATLELFTHWYNQQIVRKTNIPTEATTEVPDHEYKSLLHEFVSTCLSQSQDVAILHNAVDCDFKYNVEVVRSVLECGGNSLINAFDKRGRRPLHVAVQSGNHELVSLLLEFGAHVDAVNCDGCSAAEVVGRRNTEPIQQILSDLLPLPLTCQASRTVVATEIQYEMLDLPLHIKNFIKLHDKHAH